MLCAHPLSPLLSLHHIDAADPIFPLMNKTESMEHLFKAARIDPYRILQQTVCYDNVKVLTVSVSWGYSVQVYEGNVLLPDLLRLQKTFMPWRRNRNLNASRYMFNTRIQPKDPCKNPTVFFRQSLIPDGSGTLSSYRRYKVRKCVNSAINDLKHVNVFSTKLEIDTEEVILTRHHMISYYDLFFYYSLSFLPFLYFFSAEVTKKTMQLCSFIFKGFNGYRNQTLRNQ